MNLETREPSRFITVVFVPSSGLAQCQANEINKRAKELGAVKDVAIYYDGSKIGSDYMDDIKDGKYQWVYISPTKVLHPYVMRACGMAMVSSPKSCYLQLTKYTSSQTGTYFR